MSAPPDFFGRDDNKPIWKNHENKKSPASPDGGAGFFCMAERTTANYE